MTKSMKNNLIRLSGFTGFVFFLLMVTACANPEKNITVLSTYEDVDWTQIHWKKPENLACYRLNDYEFVEYEKFRIKVPAPDSHLIVPIKSNSPVTATWGTDLELGYQQQFKGFVRREKIPMNIIDLVNLQDYLFRVMPHGPRLEQREWKGFSAIYFESENMDDDAIVERRRGYAVLDPVESGAVYLVYYWIREYKNLKGNRPLDNVGQQFLDLVEINKK